MDKTTFQTQAVAAFDELCRAYGLSVSEQDGYWVRFDGREVFLYVAYDGYRTCELGSQFGLRAGVVRSIERPFELSELLRVEGRYELPEAQHDIVAPHAELPSALGHLVRLYTLHGQKALRGDLAIYQRLDTQRDDDCDRYELEPALFHASVAAHGAWARGDYKTIVELLGPFQDRLNADERKMLNDAQGPGGLR